VLYVYVVCILAQYLCSLHTVANDIIKNTFALLSITGIHLYHMQAIILAKKTTQFHILQRRGLKIQLLHFHSFSLTPAVQ